MLFDCPHRGKQISGKGLRVYACELHGTCHQLHRPEPVGEVVACINCPDRPAGAEPKRGRHVSAVKPQSLPIRLPSLAVPSAPGLGSQLKQLLSELGLEACAPCAGRAAQMDAWGVEECRRRREEIISWLRTESAKVGWVTKLTAAGKAIKTGLAFRLNPLDPAPGLFEEALRRASNDQSTEMLPGIRDPIGNFSLPSEPELRQQFHIVAFWQMIDRTSQDMPGPIQAEGDGIVYCGGGRFWPMIVLGIRMLRDTGSQVPVKVYHHGQAEPVNLLDLAGIKDVEVINGETLRPTPRIYQNQYPWVYASKTIALAHCGFRRVLYLDADAYCVEDPVPLFKLASTYRVVYWKNQDFYDRDETKRVRWEQTGLNNDTLRIPVVQGGQWLFDRVAAWRELVLLHWLNMHADYWYGVSGIHDETCFRLALLATGGRYLCLEDNPFNGTAFVPKIEGKPVIVHRSQAKIFGSNRDRRDDSLPREARLWELFGKSPAMAPATASDPSLNTADELLQAHARWNLLSTEEKDLLMSKTVYLLARLAKEKPHGR